MAIGMGKWKSKFDLRCSGSKSSQKDFLLCGKCVSLVLLDF